MRRLPPFVALAALVASLVTASPVARADDPPTAPASRVRAGVGIADATWHVGSGAGQYAPDRGAPHPDDHHDPHAFAVKSQASYGVQSRLTMRALVVEGSNGQQVALVKSDAYLAQDLLTRRVAQLLAEQGSSIDYSEILLSASHNHSSPYNVSPSAGVQVFQDAFDLRMFEWEARQVALAIRRAEADLRPARMGGTVVRSSVFKGNIMGPGRADDGTPAGYPRDFGDEDVTVLRFDDLTDPANPRPLATWVNYGQHPESLDGHNLISADYLSALERYVDRETGGTLVFSQGDVGSAEGPYHHWSTPEQLPEGTYRVWAHEGFAQMERGARLLADAVLEGWRAIGAAAPGVRVPMTSDFPVIVYDRWTPGPVSHPYPSLSNCRTESTVEGNPGVPVGSDCSRPGRDEAGRQEFERLKAAGVPVPDHYDHPGYLLLEENNRIRLQAVRLGEVLLASCSCEAQVDLILNLKSRADAVPGNIWDGYDWSWSCSQNPDGTWTCAHGRVTDLAFRRMQAQVHNDAKGWDDPAYAPYANSEPLDPAQIKGNFTKEELPPSLGYALPVGLGHTGDYVGYTVSYREYMTRNHYRKSLTSHGPHTADYMVTRLVRMAGAMKGGPAVADEPLHAAGVADEARAVAFSEALGRAAAGAYEAWQRTLADDADPGRVVAQPAPSMERFRAATFTWTGGSNAVDNPVVRVERLVGDAWQPYADQSGEVQTFLAFPKGVAGVADARTGRHQWRWSATFEAFDAFPRATVPGGQVPDGTYRFVVDGVARQGGADRAYSVVSDPFRVTPWTGIQVRDLRAAPDGTVSFEVPPIAYPRTYQSSVPLVRDDGRPTICKTCSFRPWAKTGQVASASVRVTRASGTVETVAAAYDAASGRWVAAAGLRVGDVAEVVPGGVVDTFGEVNGVGAGPVAGVTMAALRARRPA